MKLEEANVTFVVENSEQCQFLEKAFGIFLDHAEFEAPDPSSIKFSVEIADGEIVRVIPDVSTATITLKNLDEVRVGVNNRDLIFTVSIDDPDDDTVVQYVLSENEA